MLLNVSQLNLMSVEYVNKQSSVQNNLIHYEIAIITNKPATFQHYPVGKTVCSQKHQEISSPKMSRKGS